MAKEAEDNPASSPATETIEIDLKDPNLAAFLAWLIPGAGHLYQGRTAKGILFMSCILGTFVFGMVLGKGRVVYAQWQDYDTRWAYFCQIPNGLPTLPALVQSYRETNKRNDKRLKNQNVPPGQPGNLNADGPNADGPNADGPNMNGPNVQNDEQAHNQGWSRMYAPPEKDELADLHLRLNKHFEIGTMFTMVAGLLNILAIYDAWAGPVVIDPRSRKRKKKAKKASEDTESPPRTPEQAK